MRTKTFSGFLILFLISITSTALAQTKVTNGEDWNCFLGPRNNGVSLEKNLLEKWPDNGPPQIFNYDIGTGYSSPSIKDNKLVIHYRKGRSEVLECLDSITAKQIWKQSYPSDYRDPYGYNNGPRCSPVLTSEKCFTLGAEGKLTAVKMSNGDILWQRDFIKELDVPENFFGFGCSPLLENNRLYIIAGGQPDSGILCLDADSGKTIWQHVGKETWDKIETGWPRDPVLKWSNKEVIAAYGSPVITTIHNKKMLLALLRHGLVAVDPANGQELFKYFFRAKIHESVNASTPVVVGNQILISAAYGMGARMLEVQPDGKGVKLVWSNDEFDTHWSTAIEYHGSLYGFCGRHENEARLRCIDLKTGKTRWATMGFDGNTSHLKVDEQKRIIDTNTGKFIPFPYFGRGSMTLVDNKFIILGERGTLTLATPDSTKYNEISRFAPVGINYPSWAAPVISHGILYLRSEDHLVAYDLRKK